MNLRNRRQLLVALVIFSAACAGRMRPPATAAAPAEETPPVVILPVRVEPQITPPVTSDDIAQVMDAVLGDSLESLTAIDSLNEEISSDLEVLAFAAHDRVTYFVNLFAGDGKARTEERLSRGTRFENMIRSKLRAADLPEDLYYLALIESGFDVDAYSRAAAVGMWQFMTATAKAEGLKVDWWVDERRDPVRSTDAAVRHLSWLRRQFGSFFLAAAAYNGGSGTISRGLTRHAVDLGDSEGEDVFFALAETNSLKQETRDYVPKLIAATLVAKSARRYELRFDTLAAFTYDSVKVGPAVPLAAVAKASQTPLAQIVQFNPHVLRGFTHPKDSMYLRVPEGAAAGFSSRFRALSANDLLPYTKTASRPGETFAAVARRVGVTAKRLAWYNPRDGQTTRALAAGSTILVPTAEVIAGARDVPDPAIEIYGGSGTRHVVKSGESLSTIAKRYGTTVAALKRLNNLRSDLIRAGQSLRVR